jgi:hypothetical protein
MKCQKPRQGAVNFVEQEVPGRLRCPANGRNLQVSPDLREQADEPSGRGRIARIGGVNASWDYYKHNDGRTGNVDVRQALFPKRPVLCSKYNEFL